MLYDFQIDIENRVFEGWHRPNVFNIGMQLPTGGGKTVVMSDIVAKMNTATCAIAHRQELVSQMSLALNRDNITHSIIAPRKVQQQIIKLHHDWHGYSRYRYSSEVRVAGVDSLSASKDRWFNQVGLVLQDEGHHVLKDNKWGKAMGLFPNGRGLFPTAHPLRADGNGLGRIASGLMDQLVLGPSCRDLITRGFLTDYDIYCPESDINFSEVAIGPSGELVQKQLRAATHESKSLVGDVVKEYLRLAPGKLGVTFAVDIEDAKKIWEAYNAAGVRAEIITSKTPIAARSQYLRQFRDRILLQLVSVDCLGEGVDVPAIEVVSMARRTASFQVYAQQLGRALRLMLEGLTFNSAPVWKVWGALTDQQRLGYIAASRKPKAIIIDHVGNTVYFAQWHGRPCSRQNYTMEDAPAKTRLRKGPESLRTCVKGTKNGVVTDGCYKPYERFLTACPYCGVEPAIFLRVAPEQVDGDIVLLDPEALSDMQAKIDKIDGSPPPTFDGPIGGTILKNHYNRQRQQASLRRVMTVWGGWRLHSGETLREAHKRFYLTFGVDVMGAKILGAPEALALEIRIQDELNQHNIVEAQAA
jgi:DNA repair protein RadD